mgnify:FL=1
MKMKELPISERPYEKLEMYGERALSNAELIAIIIKSGTREESSVNIAQKILSLEKNGENNLRFLQNISIEEFMSIKGIGKVKAIQLKAICELTKRMSKPLDTSQIQINSPKDVAELLTEEMKFEKREIVKTLILNSKNIVIKIVDVCFGGTNSAILKPKDVLQEAIKLGAPKIILVHNHPSGDPTPSQKDFDFTERLIQASKIIGVELLDHIIIGDYGFESIFYLKNNS